MTDTGIYDIKPFSLVSGNFFSIFLSILQNLNVRLTSSAGKTLPQNGRENAKFYRRKCIIRKFIHYKMRNTCRFKCTKCTLVQTKHQNSFNVQVKYLRHLLFQLNCFMVLKHAIRFQLKILIVLFYNDVFCAHRQRYLPRIICKSANATFQFI